jgi:hypothetical protein
VPKLRLVLVREMTSGLPACRMGVFGSRFILDSRGPKSILDSRGPRCILDSRGLKSLSENVRVRDGVSIRCANGMVIFEEIRVSNSGTV